MRVKCKQLENEGNIPLEARLNATSSPSSKIFPSLGNSSPAIMRKVVVLPQPEGPSITKNDRLGIVKVEFFTAMKSPNAFLKFSI